MGNLLPLAEIIKFYQRILGTGVRHCGDDRTQHQRFLDVTNRTCDPHFLCDATNEREKRHAIPSKYSRAVIYSGFLVSVGGVYVAARSYKMPSARQTYNQSRQLRSAVMSFAYRELAQTSCHSRSVAAIDQCLRASSEPPESSPLWCPALSSRRESQYTEHGKLHDFLQRLAEKRRTRTEKGKRGTDLTASAHTTASLLSGEESLSVNSLEKATTRQRQRNSKPSRRRRTDTNRPRSGSRLSSSLLLRHSYGGEDRQRFAMETLLVQKS